MHLTKVALPISIAVILSLTSCTSKQVQDTPNSEVQTDSTINEVVNTVPNEDSSNIVWGVYQGNLGLYSKHVVMEIEIDGEQVTGSYFYSKHQKLLELAGTFDPATHLVKVTESYKGKQTGYMEFTLIRGELNGHWMLKPAAEKEDFNAVLVDINRQDYHPVFNRYEQKHVIELNGYDKENDMHVTDELMVNRISPNLFSFYYHVTRTNAHLGSLEGIANYAKENVGIYTDNGQCEFTMTFDKNAVKTEETGDCSYYHGAFAHFYGELTKVK